jgi:hypothetical protein
MKALLFALFLPGILPAAAGLEFETPAIKVEADLNDKVVTREFKFKNSGEKAVKIKEADAGCSCLAVEVAGGKFTYAPGESGVLRAVFELGSFQGTVDKQINVWLEGDPEEKPSTSLTMSVHIPVIIKLEPKAVKWLVGDPAEPKVIDIEMDYAKPIHVTSVGTSNASFSTKLITVEEGKHYKLEITPVNGTGEAGLSVVRIETDVDVDKQRVQQGFAVISAPRGKTK